MIKIRFCRGNDLFLFPGWLFPIIFLMKASYLINSGFGRTPLPVIIYELVPSSLGTLISFFL